MLPWLLLLNQFYLKLSSVLLFPLRAPEVGGCGNGGGACGQQHMQRSRLLEETGHGAPGDVGSDQKLIVMVALVDVVFSRGDMAKVLRRTMVAMARTSRQLRLQRGPCQRWARRP